MGDEGGFFGQDYEDGQDWDRGEAHTKGREGERGSRRKVGLKNWGA